MAAAYSAQPTAVRPQLVKRQVQIRDASGTRGRQRFHDQRLTLARLLDEGACLIVGMALSIMLVLFAHVAFGKLDSWVGRGRCARLGEIIQVGEKRFQQIRCHLELACKLVEARRPAEASLQHRGDLIALAFEAAQARVQQLDLAEPIVGDGTIGRVVLNLHGVGPCRSG